MRKANFARKEVIHTAYTDVKKYMERQSEMSEEEAVKLIEKAEEAVGLMTGFVVEKQGLDSFGAFEKQMLEKAVFSQADYILENGGSVEDSSGEPVSVTIGSFSYSYGTASAAKTSSQSGFSKAALGYLEAAGVLSRRIGVK